MAVDRKSPEQFSRRVPSVQDRNLKRRSIALYLPFAVRSSLARLLPVPARCPSAANAFDRDRSLPFAGGASCPPIPCESEPRKGPGTLCHSRPLVECLLQKRQASSLS